MVMCAVQVYILETPEEVISLKNMIGPRRKGNAVGTLAASVCNAYVYIRRPPEWVGGLVDICTFHTYMYILFSPRSS